MTRNTLGAKLVAGRYGLEYRTTYSDAVAIEFAQPVVSSSPCTLYAEVFPASGLAAAGFGFPISVWNTSFTHTRRLFVNGVTGVFAFQENNGANGIASATNSINAWYSMAGVSDGGARRRLYINDVVTADDTTSVGVVNGNNTYIGSGSGGNYWDGGLRNIRTWSRNLSSDEVREIRRYPFAVLIGDPRRRWFLFGAETGSGTTVTASASGRMRARGADVVAPIKAAAETGRLRARGATSAQPISVVAVAGRLRARSADVVTSIRPTPAAGRLRARGGCSTTHVSAGIVVTSAAGRLRARGGCATTSIRAVAVTGLIKARGADAATSIRVGLAAGRIKARGANSAAAVVAGTVVTSAAGRLRARGSSSSTTTRIVGEVGRLRLRGVVTVATIRPAAVGGRLWVRGHTAAGPYVAPVTLSVDLRYLVSARGRHFTASTRGRRFIART